MVWNRSLKFSRRKTPGGQRGKVFPCAMKLCSCLSKGKTGRKMSFFPLADVGSRTLRAIQGDWPWASSSLAVSSAFTLCWEPGCSWKAVVKLKFGDSRERKRLPHFITALSRACTQPLSDHSLYGLSLILKKFQPLSLDDHLCTAHGPNLSRDFCEWLGAFSFGRRKCFH